MSLGSFHLKLTTVVVDADLISSIFFVMCLLSIGMGSSRRDPAGQTVLSASHNAPSLLDTRFCTSSLPPTRRGRSGTTRIIVRIFTFFFASRLNVLSLATQYCDGLRGAMVVYDLFDPHRSE